MKRIIALLLVSTITIPVLAQDVQTVPPGDDKIVPLKLNQPAPFDGQLFSPETALRWANWLKQYQLVLKLNHEYDTKTCAAETKYLTTSVELEQARYKTVTDDYQAREAALQNQVLQLQSSNPPWYTTVWFGALLGVVVTGTAVGLGVYAAK